MKERLARQLAFALELDKEKSVFRQTHRKSAAPSLRSLMRARVLMRALRAPWITSSLSS